MDLRQAQLSCITPAPRPFRLRMTNALQLVLAPSAAATLLRKERLGGVAPCSRRAILDCLVPYHLGQLFLRQSRAGYAGGLLGKLARVQPTPQRTLDPAFVQLPILLAT